MKITHDEDINPVQELSEATYPSRTLGSGIFNTNSKVDEYFIIVMIGTPPQEFNRLLEFSKQESIIYDDSCQGTCPKPFIKSASSTFEELPKSKDEAIWIRGTDTFSLGGGLDVQEFEFVIGQAPRNWNREYDRYLVRFYVEFTPWYWKDFCGKVICTRANCLSQLRTISQSNEFLHLFRESCYEICHDKLHSFACERCLESLCITGDEDIIKVPVEAQFHINRMPIWLPREAYNTLYNQLCDYQNMCFRDDRGYTKLKCSQANQFPDLILNIQLSSFALSDQFYLQRIDTETCWLMVLPRNDNTVILGLEFFYSYYLAFDFNTETVAVALSINAKTREGSHIQLVGACIITAIIILFTFYLFRFQVCSRKRRGRNRPVQVGGIDIPVGAGQI